VKDIVSDEDVLGNSPRLEGTRIGVLHIYRQYENGASPEEIAGNYDGISVADVHAALAFVFDNPELIRQRERRNQTVIEGIREQRPVDPEEFTQQL
jgi:uncharacterized protein (DUF433 family)